MKQLSFLRKVKLIWSLLNFGGINFFLYQKIRIITSNILAVENLKILFESARILEKSFLYPKIGNFRKSISSIIFCATFSQTLLISPLKISQRIVGGIFQKLFLSFAAGRHDWNVKILLMKIISLYLNLTNWSIWMWFLIQIFTRKSQMSIPFL